MASDQNDGKPHEVEPIDTKEIDWMNLGEISVRDEGESNVLIVAPHGYPGDDDNTEILAALLAEELDCFAVVNNRKYNRQAPSGSYRFTEDLNDVDQAPICPDFWDPLVDRLRHIVRHYPKFPLVLFLHGMSDANADEYVGKNFDFAIGVGCVGKHDPLTASASRKLLYSLKKLLSESIGKAQHGVERYAARNRVPTILTYQINERGVEAVQLEIRYTGYRDTRDNLEKLAKALAKVIKHDKMKPFVTAEPREEPLPADIFDDSSDTGSSTGTPEGSQKRSSRKPGESIPEPCDPSLITIDQEFQKLVHDLDPAELNQLEENLKQDGCLEPLVVWEHGKKLILLDGHHRFGICTKNGIPFSIVKLDLNNRHEAILWIVDKQVGRRNLVPFSKIELLQPYESVVRQEARDKQKEGHKRRGRTANQKEPDRVHTHEIMARKAGVSPRTYQKAADIIELAPEEIKEQLRKSELSIDAAHKLINKSKPKKEEKKPPNVDVTSAGAEGKSGAEGESDFPSPSDVIVINNAWGESAKGIGTLADLPIDKAAKENCVLWLWTPVAQMRRVFEVLDKWGFTFQTLFTWVKPEPVPGEFLDDLTEYCIVASKGSPKINRDREFRTALTATAKTGTREPLGFFTMVEQRCVGKTRLEVFAESSREGWAAWPPLEKPEYAEDGNEPEEKKLQGKGKRGKVQDTANGKAEDSRKEEKGFNIGR